MSSLENFSQEKLRGTTRISETAQRKAGRLWVDGEVTNRSEITLTSNVSTVC